MMIWPGSLFGERCRIAIGYFGKKGKRQGKRPLWVGLVLATTRTNKAQKNPAMLRTTGFPPSQNG